MTRGSYIRVLTETVVLTALVLAGMGCNAQPAQWSNLGDHQDDQVDNQGRRVNVNGLHVVPVPGRYITQLRAADVVKILKIIGCSNDQILAIGSDLRDALAQNGMA